MCESCRETNGDYTAQSRKNDKEDGCVFRSTWTGGVSLGVRGQGVCL